MITKYKVLKFFSAYFSVVYSSPINQTTWSFRPRFEKIVILTILTIIDATKLAHDDMG